MASSSMCAARGDAATVNSFSTTKVDTPYDPRRLPISAPTGPHPIIITSYSLMLFIVGNEKSTLRCKFEFCGGQVLPTVYITITQKHFICPTINKYNKYL